MPVVEQTSAAVHCEDLVKVSRYAAHVGVPLFFVGVGDEQETRDVYLHDLQVEDSVYVHDRVVFELRLTAQGYDRLTAPVTLKEKGKDKVLAQQSVTVDGSGKSVKVRLVHQPTEPGEKIGITAGLPAGRSGGTNLFKVELLS